MLGIESKLERRQQKINEKMKGESYKGQTPDTIESSGGNQLVLNP